MSLVAEFDEQQRNFILSIEAARSSLQDASQPPTTINVDHMKQLISDHQRHLNEASTALPAHSVRTYQAVIDEWRAIVQDITASLQPKKKFAFKSRGTAPRAAAVSEPPVLRTSEEPSGQVETKDVVDDRPGSLTIDGTDVGTITAVDTSTHPSLLDSSIITLKSLSEVTIDLRKTSRYVSVTLVDLQGCTVQTGDASSSLFISNCTVCKIEGEAQQIRIHTSHDCDVKYVCRAAQPVIEKCSRMRFLNLKSSSQTAEKTVVDDFSDLSGSGRNWSVLTS